ncbi:unnamed protein product, partial [Allacma fusca]
GRQHQWYPNVSPQMPRRSSPLPPNGLDPG